MESLIIYPNTPRQYEAIKVLLEEMKIRFSAQKRTQKVKLSQAEKDSILAGMRDVEDRNFITEAEADEIFEKIINQVD
jgi:predicted transcriptional regulator